MTMYKDVLKALGRVAVLFGGSSREREISIDSGRAVLNALIGQGVDAHAFDPATDRLLALREFDRAFIALHGQFGEDGTIQGKLDAMGVPYTGSGGAASKIGMNKWQCKTRWREVGVNTPDFALVTADSEFAAIAQKLGLPLFVKPANEGSSIGISKVSKLSDFQAAYRLAAQSDSIVIAEKYIDAGEYTVSVLDGRPLPIVKINAKNEFYDFEAKYTQHDTEYLCPCDLSGAKEKQIQQAALKAFNLIGCKDWGRVDFLMDHVGQHYFIELNTVPGMTSHSLLPMAAKAAGICFDELVMQILQLTLRVSGKEAGYVA